MVGFFKVFYGAKISSTVADEATIHDVSDVWSPEIHQNLGHHCVKGIHIKSLGKWW